MDARKMSRTDPMIREILRATYPAWTGRKIRATVKNFITFYNTNWGGGTRNEYRTFELASGRGRALWVSAPWRNPVEGTTHPIPAGWVVVEHQIFQGHDMGITLHVNPADVAKTLEGPGPRSLGAAAAVDELPINRWDEISGYRAGEVAS
jgi:hypothetical protein